MLKDVSKYLLERGVRRVVCGHKPCGDSPFVLRGCLPELVCCDTTYSDGSDKGSLGRRGCALAAVEVFGRSDRCGTAAQS